MKRCLAVYLMLFGCLSALFGVPEEDSPIRVWEKHGYRFTFEEYELAEGDFSQEEIEQFVRVRLQETGTKGLVVLRIHRGSKLLGPPPVPSSWSYGGWLSRRERYQGSEPVFAEAVSMPAGAVLRMPTAVGAKRTVLRGRDPLLVDGDGWQAEILYIGKLTSSEPAPLYPVFVRTTGMLTRERADAISSRILVLWPQGVEIKVLVRNDTWFAGEGVFFPYVYPFESQGVPPTPSEWRQTRTMR
jgi:hypothetical protein